MATEQQWEHLTEQQDRVITALATAALSDGRTLLFAGSATGLRGSSDGGHTWRELCQDDQIGLVTALAPSPTFATDRMLFIGGANGCFRSDDGGLTSQPVLTGDQVLALATVTEHDPGQPAGDRTPAPGANVVFAGTIADGIARSADAGQSWVPVNAGLLDLAILALAFSPGFGQDRTAFAGTASGLYGSRNSGRAWRWLDLGPEEPAVQCLALSPQFESDQLLLAGTEDDGLFRSPDAGESWEHASDIGERSVTAVVFAAGSGLIAAGSDDGVWFSDDAGISWRQTGAELGPVLCLAVVRDAAGDALVAGLAGAGIARSTDGGATWAPVL